MDPHTTNVAGDHSYVGAQAGIVHGDVNVYALPADASPEEKFRVGVRRLDGGMPAKAWQLINEAVDSDYVDNEVCFYWLLALVSGRTRYELSDEEAAALRNERNILHLQGDDAWADGVTVIRSLIESARRPDADIRVALKEFGRLGGVQRSLILRHMEVFLDRPIRDQMWRRAVARAERERMAGDRLNRAWKFFEPDPAGPRVRPTRPVTVPVTTWARAVAATAVLAAAGAHIGFLLVRTGQVLAFLAYLLSITGGSVAAHAGIEWRFLTLRRRAKNREYRTPSRGRSAPPDGFARRVDKQFDHYFAKYVPRGVERSVWLAETAGIRRSMRNEIVEIYRESRTSAEQISWLIRHRVGDVRRRWENGTLWEHEWKLAASLATKAEAVAGLAILIGGGLCAVTAALQTAPLSAARSIAVAVVAGWAAAHAWLHIALEYRRYAADRSDEKRALREAGAAFAAWRATLADKPGDDEMAAWLDCDRKVLLNKALQHYRLTMSDVLAHAFIEAPAPSARRARVKGGPRRYMKYRILAFLLTADGVRQFAMELDFERGTFHDEQRTNYRYDAIASVQVVQTDDDERTVELVLMNGQQIKVQVTDPGTEDVLQDETPEAVSEATLDAAGLRHTLHVLEGVAAEGREWITHEHRRGETRAKNPV